MQPKKTEYETVQTSVISGYAPKLKNIFVNLLN